MADPRRRALLPAALLLFPLLGLAAALPGCAPDTPVVAGPGPNPNPPVPPRREETRPLPPVSEDQMVWRMGGWEWVGSGYVWQAGEWEKLGQHSNEYLPGHWKVENNAWVWERGHWL